jgi:hypothetical protein
MVLVIAGCLPSAKSDPDMVNSQAWTLTFTGCGGDFTKPCPNTQVWRERVSSTPQTLCDPGCACAFDPAVLVQEDVDKADYAQSSFSELCPTVLLYCGIEFETSSSGYGECSERSPDAPISEAVITNFILDLEAS